MPQHLAIKMGPYKVRGFFHALPGADPVVAFRRRKAMVPLTDAQIEFTLHGERREIRVDTLIVNREQVDWVQAMLPTQVEFPERAAGWLRQRPDNVRAGRPARARTAAGAFHARPAGPTVRSDHGPIGTRPRPTVTWVNAIARRYFLAGDRRPSRR